MSKKINRQLLQDILALNSPAILDCLVQDTADQIVSAVNADNISGQLDWLEEHGVTESHIRACLNLKEET